LVKDEEDQLRVVELLGKIYQFVPAETRFCPLKLDTFIDKAICIAETGPAE
jgi:hypothetical protein